MNSQVLPRYVDLRVRIEDKHVFIELFDSKAQCVIDSKRVRKDGMSNELMRRLVWDYKIALIECGVIDEPMKSISRED